ncbi:hypothetical protein HMPREF0542_11703 [Ligilactobacillus ruminis ATCC 25644]|uniref:Uncharacterized protein n=1 Tax=Ligilactobacillus ruminis ATCC 25644 TaxID=525362 RepID=E7FS26_9LACO|nr:hypothetical protein HMPREF0542_11703 [Ligilactobacillus ruminis ATCC 25644]
MLVGDDTITETWMSFAINRRSYPFFCLPAGSKLGRAALKVDKNREKCVIFVYRLVQIKGARL